MNLEYFKERILPMKDMLFRFAFSYLKHTEESEDIVQEVFLKMWRKQDSLKEIKNLNAWSMTMVKNLAIDRMRSSRFQTVELQTEDSRDYFDPLRRTEAKDMLEKAHEVINSLSDNQKRVILLRDVEGHSYKEIGEMTGMDQNLVKVSLFRARENVRKKLLSTERYGL